MKFLQFRLRSLFVLTVVAACALYFAPLRGIELKRTLRKPVMAQWRNKPLALALEELAADHGFRLHIDPRALTEEGVASNTPVSIDLNQPVMLKSLMNIVLDPLNLRYEVRKDSLRGEYLQITSEQLRDGPLQTRSFGVADLISTPGDLERLAWLMQESVAPQHWECVGGRGKISWSGPARTLEVTQSQSVMEQVVDLLDQLSRIRSNGRAYLAQLARAPRPEAVSWKVSAWDRDSDAGSGRLLQEAVLPTEWAPRVDAIVQNPHRLCLWDAVGEHVLPRPSLCYDLEGQAGETRYRIYLRASGTLNIRRGEDCVQLELRADALDELRQICQQALAQQH